MKPSSRKEAAYDCEDGIYLVGEIDFGNFFRERL
jgi:hypothetical protein